MDHKYHMVSQEDGPPPPESHPQSRSCTRHQRTILTFATGVIITLMMITAIAFATFQSTTPGCSPSPDTPGPRPPLPPLTTGTDPLTQKPSSWFSGPCGRSPATARAANCRLDLVSFSWLPQSCMDEHERAEEDEFFGLRIWNFTSDLQRQHPITDLRASLESEDAPDRIYTSADWHYSHCAYMFRRLQRRFTHGQTVDGYVASEGHARHCAMIIAGARETWEQELRGAFTATRIFIKYPECV